MTATVAPHPLWWAGPPAPLALRGTPSPEIALEHSGSELLKACRHSSVDARITVVRQSPNDVGHREIFVFVDGEEIAMLRHGDAVTHEVAPGAHRIHAHNTLFTKSYDVTLQPGEHVRFTAINRAGWGTFGLLLVLGACPLYLTFERDDAR